MNNAVISKYKKMPKNRDNVNSLEVSLEGFSFFSISHSFTEQLCWMCF